MTIGRRSTSRSERRAGAKVVQEAAQLMRTCADYLRDQEYTAGGGTIHYAVDADVLRFYLDPVERVRYARVFSGEGDAKDAETERLLARLMGDFIFRRFQAGAPAKREADELLLLPTHDEEVHNMVFEVMDSVEDLREDTEDAGRTLEHLIDRAPMPTAEWLIEHTRELVEAFDGKTGPAAQLARFAALGESKVVHIERYSDRSGWRFPDPRIVDKAGSGTFEAMYAAWRERLIKHRTTEQKMPAVVRDAVAMATIEWINGKIAPDHRRLVLVTGAHGIRDASREYRIEGDGPPLTFHDLYVRDPQAFIADPSFFEPGKQDESDGQTTNAFNLVEWLNLFFPEAMRDDEGRPVVDTETLSRLDGETVASLVEPAVALGAADRPPGEKLLEEWRTQVRSTLAARRIELPEDRWPNRAQEVLRWLETARTDVPPKDRLKLLRRELTVRITESTSSMYTSTAWLGLWNRAKTRPEYVRGIPALRFDDVYTEAAEKYLNGVIPLVRARAKGADPGTMPSLDIAEMYAELAKVDSSHYHGHLIHAVAYAAKGDWHATRTLCRTALGTVAALPQVEGEGRRGREASYLLAVTERRLARDEDDFAQAHYYLEEAYRREHEGVPEDSRFISEKIALDVAKINFAVFIKRTPTQVEPHLKGIVARGWSVLAAVDKDPVPRVQGWVRRQVLINMLSLGLVARSMGETLDGALTEQMRKALRKAEEHRGKTDTTYNWDNVAEFIYLTATVVFSAAAAEREAARGKLEGFECPYSSVFDEPREVAFRRLVARRRA